MVKVIYRGSGLCPPIGYEDDKEHGFYGWIFVKHPDGNWVSLGKIPVEEDKNE